MKILWVVNIPLPEVSLLMNEKPTHLGGWLINASENLSNKIGIKLFIAFPKKGIKTMKHIKGKKIEYYAFKPVNENNLNEINNNNIFEDLINEINPDIVHIHGTELPHTISMVNICRKQNIKSVISIQGLVSIISKHIYANLPFKVIYGSTLRNILKKDSVAGYKKIYEKRAKYEIDAIKKVDNIIGRTTWDRACTLQINQNVNYHFCNETLRKSFYERKWNIDKCEKYSIFLSQGQYSLKGLHYIIEAMTLIRKEFPKSKVYIAGNNIIKSDNLKDKLQITYYGKYINKKIKENNLQSNIIFTGPLEEKKICERYLKSNVFVCPSSIENSPNSLGEAMLLGMPCIASYVGGIPDLLNDKKDGFLYQVDAPYMLANYICEIFRDRELSNKLSENARLRALDIYNEEKNCNALISIYKNIIKK